MQRTARAAVAVAVALGTACSSGGGDGGNRAAPTTVAQRRPLVKPADLEGPLAGEISRAADPRGVDLGRIGYVEEEFFASGTASRYAPTRELETDGHWEVRPDGTAPYTTRLYVRRPASPGRFSGTVVVEWLNVSAVEAAPEWAYTERAIVGTGAAWVGVSVQSLGVVGGRPLIQTGTPEQQTANAGLRGANPARYGRLSHPGDAYAFDIYAQIGAALRSPEGARVLGGRRPSHVIAAGESQSAAFLTTYVNAVEPRAHAYDGFFIHSRGAGAARLDGAAFASGSLGPYRIRTDLGVPVLVFETETDIGGLLRFGAARQADTAHLRTWEVAGTAHADAYLVRGLASGLCPHPINDGPQHYVANAAMASLMRWVERGVAPPRAEPIKTTGDGTAIVRDDHGIALGGVRTPSVDVPVKRLSGEAPAGSNLLCSLFGSSTPFDAATLRSLYSSRQHYLDRFDAALERAVDAGFVRPADRAAYAAEARTVQF